MGTTGAVPRHPVRGWGRSVGMNRLVQAVFASGFFWSAAAFAEVDDIKFRLTADATYDDNVSRARKDDKLADSFATLNLGASLPWDLTQRTRLMLNANLGAEKFERYKGLDRAFANYQAELQYRRSGQFDAPIWGLFVRQGVDRYKSELRDGYRTSAGFSVRKPATDRIFLFGALAYNLRDGRSKVFDTKEIGLRGNLDYSLTRRQTLYLGLEARDGDIVSTSRSSLKYLDIADALIQDDVFTDTARISYRFKAYTGIATLGYNFAFGERAALDIAYRAVYSQPQKQPPAGVSSDTIYYVDNQMTISFLVRF